MKKIQIKLSLACLACVGSVFLMSGQEVHASQKGYISDIVENQGVSILLTDTLTKEEYIAIAKEAEGAYWGYTNIGIANVDKNLNVREEPSTSGKLTGKMPKDAACEVVEIVGDWAKIISGEVEGYVSTEYLYMDVEAKLKAEQLVHTIARAEVDGLKIREEANLECDTIMTVSKGTELEYLGVEGDWVKITLDGEDAYVFAEYVTVTENLKTAITLTELKYGEGVSDVRVEICDYALQFLGNPYVWGGTSLTNGADCSGFTLSLYKKYGINLPHSSRAQPNSGKSVSYSEIQPGDLVFYTKNGSINHVAMYIGNGQVIHASSPSTGIKISNYNYRDPYKFVNIFGD